jgi:hypothetical protein
LRSSPATLSSPYTPHKDHRGSPRPSWRRRRRFGRRAEGFTGTVPWGPWEERGGKEEVKRGVNMGGEGRKRRGEEGGELMRKVRKDSFLFYTQNNNERDTTLLKLLILSTSKRHHLHFYYI